ncbi:MAG: terminase [Acidobacteriota bacterium]
MLLNQQLDTNALASLGALLDTRPRYLRGRTLAIGLAEDWLRVRSRTGAILPLIANPVQQLFEQHRGQHNIVLKARQLGLTTWTAARFFLKTITRPGTLTLQVAHTQQAAEEIFRIVHRFYSWLPEALREGPLATARANVRQIVFEEIDSEYRVVTAGDRNAGRGLTVQNLHCSELARWPGDPADILAGLRAALAPNAEVILESTPQGAAGCFYQEWHKAAETGTVRHFFPWWLEPAYRAKTAADPATLTEEERALIHREHLDPHQISFRRTVRSTFRKLARQEYAEDPESCFLASGESIFELTAIEARLSELSPAAQLSHNGQLQIWFPPIPGRQYLVAVDPAGGGSEGDYSAAQVIDLETGLQCAEYAAHLGGLELARFVRELAAEYNHALLVVERNNLGAAVLVHLETTCNYANLYRSGGQAGWLTTSVSRPAALARLDAALAEAPHLFMSRNLLAECRSFVRRPDGSAAAQPGAHDDRVLAMAIALSARAERAGSRE